MQHKIETIGKWIFIFAVTLFIVAALMQSAKGQEINCSWRLKLDTIKFKYLVVMVEPDGGGSPVVVAYKNDYIIQSVENFICPNMKQVITDRNRKLFFNGKQIEVIFLKQ